jgi:predicted Zn-dependent peptidase
LVIAIAGNIKNQKEIEDLIEKLFSSLNDKKTINKAKFLGIQAKEKE